MKWLLVFVTVCVVSLLVALPALAETMPCDQTTVQSLADCVQHAAEMGHIANAGLVTSLLAKTTAAQAAVDRGDNGAAVQILQAFVLQVQAQAGQHIDAEHAAHMLMHAQSVIAALRG